MPQKKRSSTKPKQLKPRRGTVSFRLLPETKEMLDHAAAQTDTTRGRYIEKALQAQFKKDGIKETK
jgi:predicted transcriptional regulator